ncbi:NUDIX hydrolase [Orrella marina]|uniref:NUDIX hydrolase n=1 Tax=Orrella marina TaxID=2163011 RepID=A0A2R4XM92_9BURK|nr:DUF4743 domain-containing protein [Orrella marina]AWB34913.1 NUDIX hydrolase [Orrella marina]
MFPTVRLPAESLQKLLLETLGRASDSPHDNSYSLMIQGETCGSVFQPAVQALQSHPDIRLNHSLKQIEINPSGELDASIADIAQSLDRAGCVPRWRGELLDLWNDRNASVAAIERGVVRPLGTLTKAVHLNAWSETGSLWVARRSLTKPTDPGMCDTLVGGLVGHGEEPALALERESFEEAGLTPDQLAQRTPVRPIACMQRRLPEGLQRELVLTSECVLPTAVTPVNQDGESMTIECLPPSEVLQMLQAGRFTVEASLVILEDLLFRVTGERPVMGSISV